MDVTNSSPIIPHYLYTIRQVAEILDMDKEWVKKNLIYNKACRHKKQGQVILIYGAWLIEWVMSEHTLTGDDE